MVNKFSSLEELLKEKAVVVNSLKELELRLSNLKITTNRLRFSPNSIPTHTKLMRDDLSAQHQRQTKYIVEINLLIRSKAASNHEAWKDVLKEIFPMETFKVINEEIERRERGLTPKKLPISAPDLQRKKEIQKIVKDTISDYHSKLLSARAALNEYINVNIDNSSKADFLAKVSKINRSLPTISELEKTKRILNF